MKKFISVLLAINLFCITAAGVSLPITGVKSQAASSDTFDSMMNISNEFSISDSKNQVCSPANIWMALAMLTDTAAGESCDQLLAVLGSSDKTALRKKEKQIYRKYNYSKAFDNYGKTVNARKNAELICKVRNSLWLDQSYNFRKKALTRTGKRFHAKTVTGVPGSESLNTQFQNWLNKSTNGLLKNQVKNTKIDPESVLTLASAVYYKAPWSDSFSERQTRDDAFHGSSGDRFVPTMHDTRYAYYMDGQSFSAAGLTLKDGNICWIVLPHDGKKPSDISKDNEYYQLLKKGVKYSKLQETRVSISLPKIDASTSKDLIGGLVSLGIKDVFDSSRADFSPISNSNDLFVNSVKHAARFKAYESGVEAAAFTAIIMNTTSANMETPVPFIVDHPFLFALTGSDNSILFSGTICDP
ncbi:MAG: serpin family protein [Lachnospiraceae bacterium]|jgi:serpin B|nr:serpin family protein [Lachnospiraceae bacterium]MEE3461975.1 serpin family protein [Lachnospiraceae bacterium]